MIKIYLSIVLFFYQFEQIIQRNSLLQQLSSFCAYLFILLYCFKKELLKFHYIIVIMILIIIIALALCNTINTQNPALNIFNTMMTQNKLSASVNIEKCFEKTEIELLLPFIIKQLNKCSTATLNQIVEITRQTKRFYHSLNITTQNCIFYNNDINLLLRKYGQDFYTLNQSFVKYAVSNYLNLRFFFRNISSLISSKDYVETGKYLNSYAHYMFGNYEDDQWVKRVENVQTLNSYYGVSVGNGVLGIVSSKTPFVVKQSVLAGVYDKYGRGRVDNIIKTFNGINAEIAINGGGFRYYNYVQQLNMKQGSFNGEFSSDCFSASYAYYALKNLPFASLITITINANENLNLKVNDILQAPEYMQKVQHYFQHLSDAGDQVAIMTSKGTSQTGKLDLVTSSLFLFQKNPQISNIYHEMWDSNRHLIRFSKNIPKGDSFTFGILSSSLSNNHHPDPINQAIRILLMGNSFGIQKLVTQHKKLWEKRWETDIIIQGNSNDQKDIRFMLYHMYSFINPSANYGLSPMGLSGLGYNGHIFWDMDLWMYPGVLGLDPKLARPLINYRSDRLQQAVNNAFINGYQGAMFPWQSSQDGTEETPVWALSGPLQHHITGCVAVGAWNYFAVTQDKKWLREKGYDILNKAAEFWQSRVQKVQGVYHINNVVGADEWAQNVNDDAFTNAVAKKTLKLANKASAILGYQINPDWQEIADNIVILKFENNVTKQHQTYRGQSIKQADVNLLAYPLKEITNDQDILRDLVYYQSKIPDGGTPAMTYSIFTILYSRLKDPINAYKYFKQSYQPYLREPFGVFSQTKGGTNPYFMTGAGGVLQSMIFGFGGYDITDEGIVKIETAIPNQWTRVQIKSKVYNKSKKILSS